MAQHVRVNLERKARFPSCAFDEPIKAISREWSTTFAHKHERRFWSFPLKLAQRSQLIATNRMRARLPALHSADMKRCRVPVELLPTQVANFRSTQAVPIGNQDHGRVPVTVSIVLCGLDKLFNLSFGQMLSAAKLAVRPAHRGNCSFFGGWLHQLEVRFGHGFLPPAQLLIVQYSFYEQYARQFCASLGLLMTASIDSTVRIEGPRVFGRNRPVPP